MLSNINDYVFYEYSKDFIEQFSKDQANTFTTLGNGWCMFTQTEVFDLMTAVINLYYFKTHSMILLHCGRQVPIPEKLKLLTEQLRVPRYMRDIAREFCRPMIFNNNIYLPDIKFVNSYGESAADLFSPIKDTLMKWEYTITKLGCDVVSIETEAPRPVPISFYDSTSQEIWMAKQLPEWRLEAFLYLRHLKYYYFEGIELSFRSDASVNQSRKAKGKDNNTEKEFDLNPEDNSNKIEPQLFNMRRSGRRVGGFAGFIASTLNHNRAMGFVPLQFRFATIDEEHFSSTPPQSRRASDMNECNNRSRGEHFKLRNPSINDAGEKLTSMTKRRKSMLNKKTMLE